MRRAAIVNIGFLGFHLYYQIFGDYTNDSMSAVWFSVLSLVIFFTLLDCISSTFSKGIRRLLRLVNVFWAYFFITEIILLFNIDFYSKFVEYRGVSLNEFNSFIEITNTICYGAFFLIGIVLLIFYTSIKNDFKSER